MKRFYTLLLAMLLVLNSGAFAETADKEPVKQNYAILPAGITATSELVEDGLRFKAENAIDGNPATCWAEGAEEYGIGESITLFLLGTYNISEIVITPGWVINSEFFDRNAKPKEIRITTSTPDEVQYIALEESASAQSFKLDLERIGWVTLEIEDIYEGTKGVFDTCISEIALYGIESLDDPETRLASMFEVAESLATEEQDYEEAFKWYKMSAEGGYAPAQNVVGMYFLCIKEGFTVEKGVGGIPTAFAARYGHGHPVIGITENEIIAGYMLKPRHSRGQGPSVFLRNDSDTRVLISFDHLLCIVGRTIIDDDDLDVGQALPKDGIQGLVYVLAGVIGRDDNRDLHFSRLKTSCFWVLLKQT